MDKAYNVFLCLIIFALIMAFLPRIGKILGYKEGGVLSRSIFGGSEVIVSFDGGKTFLKSNQTILDKVYLDESGTLFTLKDKNLFRSLDGGKTWYEVSEIVGFDSRSVLETESGGRIFLK